MYRDLPYGGNRLVRQRAIDRQNAIILKKLRNIKFKNFSSLNSRQIQYNKKERVSNTINLNFDMIQHIKAKSVIQQERSRLQKYLYDKQSNWNQSFSQRYERSNRTNKKHSISQINQYSFNRKFSLPVGTERNQNEGQVRSYSRYKMRQSRSERSYEWHSSALAKRSQINQSSLMMFKISEEQKKQFSILLWSKVIAKNQNWFTVKYYRFKNYYLFELVSYPEQNIKYSLKLDQRIGTQLFTDNDYDYTQICSLFKFIGKRITLNFQLTSTGSKKYILAFERTKIQKSQQKSRQNQYLANFDKQMSQIVIKQQEQIQTEGKCMQSERQMTEHLSDHSSDSIYIYKSINLH